MTIPFPMSVLVLAAPIAVGWAYVSLDDVRARALRVPLRVVLVALVCALPLFTRGPGPVQMALGLGIGYLGIRMVALANRWRAEGHRPSLGRVALALASVDDVLRPVPPGDGSPAPARRARRALALGIGGCLATVALLVAGAEVRLWQWSRYLDDLLVCAEVGLGIMGINNLIIGVAAARGRSVSGIQNRPVLSASLGELWARRWNHLVESNLSRAFFRPLCRAGTPTLGVLAAFTASGVMHVLPVLASGPPAVTLKPAAAVLGFFLLHAGLVLAERAAGLHQPRAAGLPLTLARVRTVVVFVLLTPLLLGPFADVATIHGRQLAGAQNFSDKPREP